MPPRALLLGLALLAVLFPACKSCKSCEPDSEEEEQEEKDRTQDNFWRAQIAIVGKGTVKTSGPAFDCVSDGATQSGDCGPTLMRFKELAPPLLQATAAPGWRLDHWESVTREPDGAMVPRKGRMPDGLVYLNGFGYADTGELETVTAVFVALPPGGEVP